MATDMVAQSTAQQARLSAVVDLVVRRDPLRTFTHLQRAYGDRVRLPIGSRGVYLLSDPEDIREVLVAQQQRFGKPRPRGEPPLKRMLGDGLLTSDGDFHKRQRRLIQPAFHRQRIAGYAAVMADYAQRAHERWQAEATVDMYAEMNRLTLAIVGKTLFDADVEGDADAVRDLLTASMAQFRRAGGPLIGPLIARLPLPINRRFRENRAQLDAIIYRIIAERRQAGDDHGDLLSMLLQTQEDGDGMSDTQLRDEAMTLFLAGHETTSNALTWTWYLLAQHPAVEARLHAELDTVLDGRLPTMDDMAQLPYTTQVLSEAMRLYPPAWTIGRQAREDCEVRGLPLGADTLVIMSQYVVHHDPRHYPDPDRFDPDRWTPEARAARPKFAYFPFGGGPRLCIGESFAWTEGVMVLATLARHWQARLVPGHPVTPQPLVTLRPKYGMRMTLHRRA